MTAHANHGHLPGDFITETLVTDTRTWEVITTTAQTVTIRNTRYGERLRSENRDGNPWPCVWTEALPWPEGDTYTLRRRKDGTFRTHRSARPLRPATVIDGKPVSYRDYRD